MGGNNFEAAFEFFKVREEQKTTQTEYAPSRLLSKILICS